MKKNCVKKLCKKKDKCLGMDTLDFYFIPYDIWRNLVPISDAFECPGKHLLDHPYITSTILAFVGSTEPTKQLRNWWSTQSPTSDQKRTVQILRALHVYTIANFIACLICTLIFLGCHCALIFLGCHSALIFLRCCWNLFRVASYWISYL